MKNNAIYCSGMTPVNKTAALVLSPDSAFKPNLKPAPNIVEQRIPFDVRPLHLVPVKIRHLIGVRFGTLTVQGLSFVPSRWSVRCDCGAYVLRTTAAVTNMSNKNDGGRECTYKLSLRRNEVRRRTGRDVDVCDLPGAEKSRKPLPPKLQGGPRYLPQKLHPSVIKPNLDVPKHWTELQKPIFTTMADALAKASVKGS